MGQLNLGTSGTITASTSLSLGVVPCFSARATNSGNGVWTTSHPTPIPFDVVDVNRGNCYSGSTHKFTCPLAGVYKMDVSLISGGTDHWFRGSMLFETAGGTQSIIHKSQSDYAGNSDLDFTHCGFSIIYPFAVGDKLWVTLDTASSDTESVYCGESGVYSIFNGMFVSA